MSKPLVSIIMPVFNAEKFLREAIVSILNQSMRDFELILINDGSTDSSEAIILSFQDSRIRYEKNPANMKLIWTLNRGIDLAQGEFIARMDADDICHLDRLKLQCAYLQSHPDVDLLGANMYLIDTEGRIIKAPELLPEKPEEIEWRMLRGSCLYHPLVMGRAQVFKENRYADEFLYAEDYELWLRIMRKHRIANLPERLLYYRIHGSSLSHVYNLHQNQRASKALSDHAKIMYGLELKESFWMSFQFLRMRKDLINVEDFFANLEKLYLAFQHKHGSAAQNFIDKDYFTICSKVMAFSSSTEDKRKAFIHFFKGAVRHPAQFAIWFAEVATFLLSFARYKLIRTKKYDTLLNSSQS